MGAPSQEDVLFGKIAIKNRLASTDQVRECLGILEKNGEGVDLGRILVKKGYISVAQFQAISSRIRGLAVKNDREAAATAVLDRAPGRPAAPTAPAAGEVFTPSTVARMSFQHLMGKPLTEYLVEARRLGASDFHFQVDAPPYVRLHGHIVYFDHPSLEPSYTEARIREIFGDYEREVFEKHNDVDFC